MIEPGAPPKSNFRLHAADVRVFQWLRETFGLRVQHRQLDAWLLARRCSRADLRLLFGREPN